MEKGIEGGKCSLPKHHKTKMTSITLHAIDDDIYDDVTSDMMIDLLLLWF
jgi:hypothetical protein